MTPVVRTVSRAYPRSPAGVSRPASRRATQEAFAATKITSATNARATAKWIVTHQRLRSVRTTTPPRTACPMTSGTAATAGQTIDGTFR